MTVGKTRSHESAAGHVSGKAIYTDDQRLPAGMLSLYPVLSPHAKARITKIDPAGAYEIDGVVTVITAADVPGVNDTGTIVYDEILLPDKEISYYGQAVVWVAGETDEVARLGAEKVVVEYEPLEPILTIKDAIAAGSFHLKPRVIKRGDPTTALQQVDCYVEGEMAMNGQDHFYLETHASWVIPDGEGNYQVYASTQHPTETQIVVSRVLGINKNQVVVTCIRMGGGFGGKESQANPFAGVAAIAACKTGRPVRVKLKRHHDMILTGKRHGFLGQYKVGFTNDGKIVALDVDLYADGGWSLDLSPPVLLRAMLHVDNAYYIPHLEVRGQIAKTNKVSNTAFRGFGGPQGMVVIEDIMDRVARYLGLPPEVVRERNFYHGEGETNTTHYDQEIFDNRITKVWQQVKDSSNFTARREAIAQYNQASTYKKRGLAITPVKFGISFNKTQYNQAGALVLIYTDGSIQLNHGGTEMGQGLHTKMLQVAAQTLGVKIERLRIMPTSTEKVPNTSATAASSGADLNGQAVKDACETLKSRLAVVAAGLLKLDTPEEMVFADDWIYCRTYPSARIHFEEVTKQAYGDRISLAATGYYRTPNIYWDDATGKGRPFYYYAYGAAVSEVEVDGFTGNFKLRQVDIVHDVGESLNPLVDRGQIEGGFVQGMGWLTMEELVWDEKGRIRTYAPSTYKIPTIGEIPESFNLHLLERAAQDGVIYGSKAVGEPPLMLALSVREAIRAAVAAFGDTDYVPLASPATPEAILWAVEYVRDRATEAVEAVGEPQPVSG
ncbi:xanthine dehydrogenase molybdopterin binding subunit [Chroococcidiopsis sp. CCNUC1]|uniref:xanthine dehydrogenase molybdopterin binding subunit n=1 Tax=Chroococcidiopsis sp. CCNUC1 TaxID=2653189 RepID=UPI000D077800|nr:xanthine dehydrogenase molybdopterin binding subunit [Chroococcidiopsis sp. CCNUC1]PSB42595.1 xanthine dehydrogenase molybdopterin binding subunit [Cyanosarcina cf. burmensis CCALA 770]URD52340.1 xanthine dehydrogenase molybdopterin binding subunit [Chroococcidiopsis sp. CCNUC1]